MSFTTILGPTVTICDATLPSTSQTNSGSDWGEAIDFGREQVRDFYLRNAAYWVEEFHFDGLRLDATQDIHDLSEEHILAALSKRVRARRITRRLHGGGERASEH